MQQVVKKFNGCDKHRTSVDTKETLEKTEKIIKNGQSRETQSTLNVEKQSKNTTQYVLDTTMRKQAQIIVSTNR